MPEIRYAYCGGEVAPYEDEVNTSWTYNWICQKCLAVVLFTRKAE